MSIPFYRYVEYWNDGHYIFQCLHCGEKIDVGSGYHPRFCCDCGVEYKGFILPKKIDYVSLPTTSKKVYAIERGIEWDDDSPIDDKTKITWESTWMETDSPKQAVEFLRIEREKAKDPDEKPMWGKRKFRIVMKSETVYHRCDINLEEYRRRTGKNFDRDDYEVTA
jgi:hypothetical protein